MSNALPCKITKPEIKGYQKQESNVNAVPLTETLINVCLPFYAWLAENKYTNYNEQGSCKPLKNI